MAEHLLEKGADVNSEDNVGFLQSTLLECQYEALRSDRLLS